MTAPGNLIVFAPAGSGKTERLSGRYIDLLESGVAPERILTLTFTEKAAAEMKQRIFERLSTRNPELHRRLRADALKLRISTIHSFCLTLVRRFAPALGLDPRVEVISDPGELWTAAKYDTLMNIAAGGDGREALELLLHLVTRDERIGWPGLSELFDKFFSKRTNIARAGVTPADRARLAQLTDLLRRHPLGSRLADQQSVFFREPTPAAVKAAIDAIESQRRTFLNKDGSPQRPRARARLAELEHNALVAEYYGLLRVDHFAAEFARSFELFRSRFLAAYDRRKRERGAVDYDDMEYLALRLLEREPDWQNVLRAFDEHTDHLLVDEFQDTSFLQWGIIDRLTEEWRAGEGAKADRGIEPTVFLVGDDKQSIYMFRDAQPEVFRTAAGRLREWLGAARLEELTIEDNYRSLGAIIDFTNALFSKLMGPTTGKPDEKSDPWRTRYAPFRRQRNNPAPGTVEVILSPCGGRADERRACDAATVARRIRSLVDPANPFVVYDRNPDGSESGRACRFADISVLIRARNGSLPALEEAFLAAGIPFLVAGGTGFYAEPEVRYAIALATALADPDDDLALYATLRGPVFAVRERELFLAADGNSGSLLDRLRQNSAPDSDLAGAIEHLDRWRARIPVAPLSRILETALAERRVWEHFWEPQRVANLRKLLGLIEDRATNGEGALRIVGALAAGDTDEAKADVRPEGRDSVQIMTIHAAKGLQFPVVFVPGLDDQLRPIRYTSGEELVIEETGPDSVLVSWLPDAALRHASDFHMTFREKEIEEEKRVFYVACTRARDGLFLTGALHLKTTDKSRLGWLAESAGLRPDEFRFDPDLGIDGLRCISALDIADAPAPPPDRTRRAVARAGLAVSPPPIRPRPRVQSVTGNTGQDIIRSGPEAIGVGDAIHRLLELISKSEVDPDRPDFPARVEDTLRRAGLSLNFASGIRKHIARLRSDAAVWPLVEPRMDAEAELPVMYLDGETLWSGRIDRLILTDAEARIYDYKTFDVEPDAAGTLAREYHRGQLCHYAEAVRRLHPGREVSTFVVFTTLPLVVRTS
jgi:ATP-dependent helicase/nuclease subunit A